MLGSCASLDSHSMLWQVFWKSWAATKAEMIVKKSGIRIIMIAGDRLRGVWGRRGKIPESWVVFITMEYWFGAKK